MVFGESVSCSGWQIGGEGSVLGVFMLPIKLNRFCYLGAEDRFSDLEGFSISLSSDCFYKKRENKGLLLLF